MIAGRRVLRALVALPRQIVEMMRGETGRSAASAPSFHLPAERSRATGVGRATIGLLMATVANIAALVLVFALARAIYYPFWAVGASESALDRSWGGPSAVGATLVHWLVAAGTVVVSYVVILVTDRLAEQRGWGSRVG